MKRLVRASEGIILDTADKYTVAAQIALNLKSEWDAIEGYDKLIPFLKAHNDQESIDHIEEIISDELNHAELLRGIIKKYDGNIKTAKN